MRHGITAAEAAQWKADLLDCYLEDHYSVDELLRYVQIVDGLQGESWHEPAPDQSQIVRTHQ
jgi:hypothetical protein